MMPDYASGTLRPVWVDTVFSSWYAYYRKTVFKANYVRGGFA